MSEPMTCGNINVEAGLVHLGASWEEQSISITVQKRKKSLIPTPTTHSHFVDLSVTHLKYTSTVYNTEKFLAFLSHARSCSAHQGKVLYTCRNGADMSGLACVLSLLLDRFDNDHYLTVPLVVGAVKTIRQQVIPTLDQYKMLYQLVKLYSESESVYYNHGHANNSSKGQSNPAFVSTSDEDRYVYANL
ncbi:unnamed protein product [Lymnaea stagnalis]|uniref:Tyrosine specific protein phosphatases domain-containing protein n=1 Tax=Lymnaea stagnalis TaxID=6523 RepID=A0AAV2IQL0_LYMST